MVSHQSQVYDATGDGALDPYGALPGAPVEAAWVVRGEIEKIVVMYLDQADPKKVICHAVRNVKERETGVPMGSHSVDISLRIEHDPGIEPVRTFAAVPPVYEQARVPSTTAYITAAPRTKTIRILRIDVIHLFPDHSDLHLHELAKRSVMKGRFA